jgi:hypothetical protein
MMDSFMDWGSMKLLSHLELWHFELHHGDVMRYGETDELLQNKMISHV